MLKAVVIAGAICASGVVLWAHSRDGARKDPAAVESNMPSITELHSKARMEILPIQEVKDPF
jgi:hypothetical protein